MSPADFATSFTFSIALRGEALLLRRIGLIDGRSIAGAGAAAGAAGGLPHQTWRRRPDLACWAAWRDLRARRQHRRRRQQQSAATAGAASNAIRQKGWRQLINAEILNSAAAGSRCAASMTNFDSARPRQSWTRFASSSPCDGAEQVEISLIVPLTHDGETIEQRNVVLLRHHAHIIQIRRHGNHRFRARAILQIHQNHVGPCLLQRSNSFVDRAAKIIGIDGSHSIDGAGLPDNQSRLFAFHQLNETGGHFLGGLLDLYFYGYVHRDRRQLLPQRRLQPRRIGARVRAV